MDRYLSQAEAIKILRELGYTNDFELFGTELLYIQQKIFIREPDYLVTECYRIINDGCYEPAVIILGITTIKANVKGVLINNYSDYIRGGIPVIIRKLAEHYFRYPEIKYHWPA